MQQENPMLNQIRAVEIFSAVSGEYVSASLMRLTAKVAAEKIDKVWWQEAFLSGANVKSERDSHWKWEGIAKTYTGAIEKDCLGILSSEDYVEGAIAFDISAKSILEEGAGALYVGWLATAPRNRWWLNEKVPFKGIGPCYYLKQFVKVIELAMVEEFRLSP
jgi:hypothetical protein